MKGRSTKSQTSFNLHNHIKAQEINDMKEQLNNKDKEKVPIFLNYRGKIAIK